MSDTVVTRFAPSPTGHLHIGGVRTALFNYLFAKHNNGEFVLRIEDTDKERNKKEYEDSILASLTWLGLKHDNNEVIHQSQNIDTYRSTLKKLIEKGSAYESEESEKGSGKVIRFRNPNKTITFSDIIRGEVSFDTTELGDFVIAKSMDEPLHHLAVVVDDNAAGITNVIRGEEHISNTPRQILILEALGYKRPTYAHLPLILATDKSKLSKRHGAVSAEEYKRRGYLPEAIVNYLALLGWHPKDDIEIFSMEGLIKEFDLSRVQKGGAVFDVEKLKSINRHHLEKITDDEFLDGVRKHLLDKYNTPMLEKLIPQIRERISVYSEIEADDIEFFFERPEYEKGKLVWKNATEKATLAHLQTLYKILESLETEKFNSSNIKNSVWDYATESGRGDVLWPMRYALSGRDKSPDPFVLADILGKDETISRLDIAIKKLS